MTLAFDTLRAARRPRAEGGFDEKQAAILVDTFSERTGETLATKVDLEKTEASLRGQMRELEQRMTICLGACCFARYLTTDFPDCFTRSLPGFPTLFDLCRSDAPVLTVSEGGAVALSD